MNFATGIYLHVQMNGKDNEVEGIEIKDFPTLGYLNNTAEKKARIHAHGYIVLTRLQFSKYNGDLELEALLAYVTVWACR